VTAGIVVLGSLNMDLVARVPVLPRPGETVMGDRLQTFCGGKGANQAVAAARLGGRVTMIGRVGRDGHGDTLVRRLERERVDAGGVRRDAGAPTGAALITVAADGENTIVVAPGANATVGTGEVRGAMRALAPGGLLVLQLEVPVAAVAQAIAGAARLGARVLLNAAPAAALDLDLVRDLAAVVVNRAEAAALLGRPVAGPAGALEAAREIRDAGAGLAVVTTGRDGAAMCDGDGARHVAPFPVTAVDGTGAGDAFAGALAVGLVAGLPAEDGVRLASAAGAAAASRMGAQDSLPRRADLKRLFGLDWPKSRRP